MIAGPCSVESEEQISAVAEQLSNLGVRMMRAGCFKPRTSPYSFQGLRHRGLDLLVKVREHYGLRIVTEVKDATHVDAVIDMADVVQVGAKAMYDHGILTACAKSRKPVLLKRGFGSTLQEFVQAAEFILSGGNENVILCERGIRTFEQKTRFTLDLCGVAYLKEYTNLPIVVDPSHAMGFAYGVSDLARAAVAMGVDGLLIEVHPNPKAALSDSAQQLDFYQFDVLHESLLPIAQAVGRRMM
jgi:3-deoxy-7-phosphoheptulonate synthase